MGSGISNAARNVYLAAWRAKNREKLKRYQREYMRARRAADPERARQANREAARKVRRERPELARKRDRDFYHSLSPAEKRDRAAKYRDASRTSIRAAASRWAKANAGKKNAETAKRRARKLMAIPPWVDRAAIRAIYANCRRITECTGVPHHVDHIIPLQGKNVCGLHVPWNLQILPAAENWKKSNRVNGVRR